MNKVTAILQMRIGSTRLPKKILKNIAGKPMLWHFTNRVKKAKLIDEIIIATTTKDEDDMIVKWARSNGLKHYRGSTEDVLDRFYQTATKFKAEVIVRVTPDCPLIDPEVMDKVIKYFLDGDFDYVSNTIKRNYPDGLDTEVFSYDALKKAWKEAKMASEREHVTPYIWKHPKMFKIGSVECEEDLSHMRWCVDTERDLEFVREIYKRLYKEGKVFHMSDVLKLLKKHPELMEINKGIARDEGTLNP